MGRAATLPNLRWMGFVDGVQTSASSAEHTVRFRGARLNLWGGLGILFEWIQAECTSIKLKFTERKGVDDA